MSTSNTSAAGSSSSATSRFISEGYEMDDHAPLWAYVTTTQAKEIGGGNRKWKCNFCGYDFNGSYSRVKAHLLKITGYGIRMCPKISDEYLLELKRMVKDAEERCKPKTIPLPNTSTSMPLSTPSPPPITIPSVDGKKRRGGPLDKAFKTQVRDELRSLIARMFYSAGLPFHLARNPYFVNAFSFAANHNLDGFVPPGYNALRTTLLQQERANIERLLVPIKSTWSEKGISLVSDGWTDVQRRPLINFMAASEDGPIFLKAIDCSGEYKDKNYMAKVMADAIRDVGPNNVVQVITDNAPVCKAAGAIIEGMFPHIFWTPCVVHTLNLALKNICAANNTERFRTTREHCGWITEVANDAQAIKNFIMNHQYRFNIFNTFVPLKLLAVAETRFASTIVMLKRFKLVKQGLMNMVGCPEWSLYREDDDETAQEVKRIICNDIWWDKVDKILDITRPIYDMLRLCDTDKPTLHLVYDMWDTMIEKVKIETYRHENLVDLDAPCPLYEVIYDILIDRWTKSYTPLHCMAHSLNPRYYSAQWLRESTNRVPPHRDVEISEERNKCLVRYFPDVTERNIVINEFVKFSTLGQPFNSPDSLESRGTFDPKVWWAYYGTSAPKLQQLALKLLGQPCSSSCCERNWSTYSFIHSIRRNKIHSQRAEDLVYVHSNLRLLSRKSEAYQQGRSRMWDIGGDNWDSFDGAGVLDVASLSLDEPELEAMLFTSSGEGNDEIDTIVV